MRRILWALTLITSLTLAAAAQHEGGGGGAASSGGGGGGGSSASGGGWSGGSSSGASPSASPSSGGGWSGGGDSRSGDWSGGSSSGASPSVSPSSPSNDRGGSSPSGGGEARSGGWGSRDSGARGGDSGKTPGVGGGPSAHHPQDRSHGSASPGATADKRSFFDRHFHRQAKWPPGPPTPVTPKPKRPPYPREPLDGGACALGAGPGLNCDPSRCSWYSRSGNCLTTPVEPEPWPFLCGPSFMDLERERTQVAQIAQQRDAACAPGPSPAAECSTLQAKYDKAWKRLQQHEVEFSQCRGRHP